MNAPIATKHSAPPSAAPVHKPTLTSMAQGSIATRSHPYHSLRKPPSLARTEPSATTSFAQAVAYLRSFDVATLTPAVQGNKRSSRVSKMPRKYKLDVMTRTTTSVTFVGNHERPTIMSGHPSGEPAAGFQSYMILLHPPQDVTRTSPMTQSEGVPQANTVQPEAIIEERATEPSPLLHRATSIVVHTTPSVNPHASSAPHNNLAADDGGTQQLTSLIADSDSAASRGSELSSLMPSHITHAMTITAPYDWMTAIAPEGKAAKQPKHADSTSDDDWDSDDSPGLWKYLIPHGRRWLVTLSLKHPRAKRFTPPRWVGDCEEGEKGEDVEKIVLGSHCASTSSKHAACASSKNHGSGQALQSANNAPAGSTPTSLLSTQLVTHSIAVPESPTTASEVHASSPESDEAAPAQPVPLLDPRDYGFTVEGFPQVWAPADPNDMRTSSQGACESSHRDASSPVNQLETGGLGPRQVFWSGNERRELASQLPHEPQVKLVAEEPEPKPPVTLLLDRRDSGYSLDGVPIQWAPADPVEALSYCPAKSLPDSSTASMRTAQPTHGIAASVVGCKMSDSLELETKSTALAAKVEPDFTCEAAADPVTLLDPRDFGYTLDGVPLQWAPADLVEAQYDKLSQWLPLPFPACPRKSSSSHRITTIHPEPERATANLKYETATVTQATMAAPFERERIFDSRAAARSSTIPDPRDFGYSLVGVPQRWAPSNPVEEYSYTSEPHPAAFLLKHAPVPRKLPALHQITPNAIYEELDALLEAAF